MSEPIYKIFQVLDESISANGRGGGRGLRKMNSVEISTMYRDHYKYEFVADELYRLLGENIQH